MPANPGASVEDALKSDGALDRQPFSVVLYGILYIHVV